MCLKQEEATSTLSRKLVTLVDQFTYLNSNISSTESNVNIRLGKSGNNFDWSYANDIYLSIYLYIYIYIYIYRGAEREQAWDKAIESGFLIDEYDRFKNISVRVC